MKNQNIWVFIPIITLLLVCNCSTSKVGKYEHKFESNSDQVSKSLSELKVLITSVARDKTEANASLKAQEDTVNTLRNHSKLSSEIIKEALNESGVFEKTILIGLIRKIRTVDFIPILGNEIDQSIESDIQKNQQISNIFLAIDTLKLITSDNGLTPEIIEIFKKTIGHKELSIQRYASEKWLSLSNQENKAKMYGQLREWLPKDRRHEIMYLNL